MECPCLSRSYQTKQRFILSSRLLSFLHCFGSFVPFCMLVSFQSLLPFILSFFRMYDQEKRVDETREMKVSSLKEIRLTDWLAGIDLIRRATNPRELVREDLKKFFSVFVHFQCSALQFLTHSENQVKGTWKTRLFESRDRRALSIY